MFNQGSIPILPFHSLPPFFQLYFLLLMQSKAYPIFHFFFHSTHPTRSRDLYDTSCLRNLVKKRSWSTLISSIVPTFTFLPAPDDSQTPCFQNTKEISRRYIL